MPAPVDFGKLLRLQSMVTEAQVAATASAGVALTRAYNDLVSEVKHALGTDEDLESLREEFARLFGEPLDTPPSHHDRRMVTAATEALVKLRQLGGWIQGLINEATFEQRIQAEAKEKAKLEARQPTGFGT